MNDDLEKILSATNDSYEVFQYTAEEALKVEKMLIAALQMKDKEGKSKPFFVPSSVALEMLRAINDGNDHGNSL